MGKIIVHGASGRMGRAVLQAAGAAVVQSLQRGDAIKPVTDSAVIIDFSSPQGCLAMAAQAAKMRLPLLTGSTGFTDAEFALLKGYADNIPIAHSGNWSLGALALAQLVAQAKKLMPAADVEIIERHHAAKKDSPSGTALLLAKQVQGAVPEPAAHIQTMRTGMRQAHEIGVVATRGGGVIGEHTVYFQLAGEELALTHRALNRDIFAQGAVAAALWLMQQKAGFYTGLDWGLDWVAA